MNLLICLGKIYILFNFTRQQAYREPVHIRLAGAALQVHIALAELAHPYLEYHAVKDHLAALTPDHPTLSCFLATKGIAM